MNSGAEIHRNNKQKNTFDFDSLCCAECARSIENELRAINGVSAPCVNYDAGTLSLELDGGHTISEISPRIQAVAARYGSKLSTDGQSGRSGGTVRLFLGGLDCADCARKIESAVRSLDRVSSANLDFVNQRLTIETADKKMMPGLLREIEGIIRDIEPDVGISRHPHKSQDTGVLHLDGLHCADCVRKIENAVRKLEGVRSANLDFVAQRLTVTASNKHRLPELLREAEEIILRTEPDAVIRRGWNIDGGKDKNTEETVVIKEKKEQLSRAALITGFILFAVGIIFTFPQKIELMLFLSSLLLSGGKVFLRSAKNITKGRVFDENFLMSIATVGAFALGDYPEGAAVMLFYRVGELLQEIAVSRSRKSITELMNIRPDYANLRSGDEIVRVSPDEVSVGDIIIVRPGEKIPLDGIVIEGRSALDTSALTGESLPRDAEPGDEVLSGSVNKSGLLSVAVKKEFNESTVSKILDLVENAGSKKAPTENFITKFARYYTPAVVFSAIALALLPPLLISGAVFSDWLRRALIFLVVSCPCALVVSIPLGFFGGIGGASRRGILIKGSNHLEALNKVGTVVFDKTGTLTRGSFMLTEINAAEGFTRDELLEIAAHAEFFSSHPIAQSIRTAYGKEMDSRRVTDYEELSGHGVIASIDGQPVLAGNAALMQSRNIQYELPGVPGSVVFIAVGGRFAGSLVIADEIRPDSRETIVGLKAAGVRKTIMLTGDSRETGERVARELGIDSVYAELLPQNKVEILEEIIGDNPGGHVVFVGDGINDAPVLARADIGVAMGGLGSDAAIEAADIVLMTDEPSKLIGAIKTARRTRAVVWQNIIFALGVKVVFLVLGAFGIATMWEAVFGDVGVTVIAVINATRTIKS